MTGILLLDIVFHFTAYTRCFDGHRVMNRILFSCQLHSERHSPLHPHPFNVAPKRKAVMYLIRLEQSVQLSPCRKSAASQRDVVIQTGAAAANWSMVPTNKSRAFFFLKENTDWFLSILPFLLEKARP